MLFQATQTPAGQILTLFVLAIPVACISWTITHEEIFREVHEFCIERSRSCRRTYQRKLFFALTCEYCVSHYVTVLLLAITGYRLLYDSWRGYLIAGFSLVWVANFYMAIFGRLRLEIKSQKLEIAQGEAQSPERQREDRFASRGSEAHR
jgi:hypothetical protein